MSVIQAVQNFKLARQWRRWFVSGNRPGPRACSPTRQTRSVRAVLPVIDAAVMSLSWHTENLNSNLKLITETTWLDWIMIVCSKQKHEEKLHKRPATWKYHRCGPRARARLRHWRHGPDFPAGKAGWSGPQNRGAVTWPKSQNIQIEIGFSKLNHEGTLLGSAAERAFFLSKGIGNLWLFWESMTLFSLCEFCGQAAVFLEMET